MIVRPTASKNSAIARGSGAPLDYPTPWAAGAATSFLSTPEETRQGLETAGFRIEDFRDTREQVLAFGERSRAMVERGERPPHRAVELIHGALAKQAAANTSRGMKEARISPIEVLARKK